MQTASKGEEEDSTGSVIGLETVGDHHEGHAYAPLPDSEPTPNQDSVTPTSELAQSET